MSRSKADSRLTPGLRRWLSHLRRCAREGTTVRAYAKHHGLSEFALYTAARELRAKGALPAAKRAGQGRAKASGSDPPVAARRSGFVEVLATEREPGAAWRARLPNGVVLEGTAELAAVVEALRQL